MGSILYIHQYFNTFEMNGSTRSVEICSKFIENGYDVIVITATKPGQKNKPSHYKGIKIKWIESPSANTHSFNKRIFAFIKFMILTTYYACAKKYSLIYCTSTPLTVGIPALISRMLRRNKYIFEVRDVWPEIPISMGVIKNKLFIRFVQFFALLFYKYSEKIIALSIDMKREIMNYGIDEKKITVAENGSRSTFFNKNTFSKKDFLELYKLDCKTKIIIYPGTFGYVNDLSYVIRLAENLGKEVCFVLVGDGIEKDKCILLAKQNNTINRNVLFLDPVSKNKIFDLISISDYLISTVADIPKLDQNSANKFSDGLRSGKCILINYKGWQKKFLEKTSSGISLSRDLNIAKDQLLKINSDSKKLFQFQENALNKSNCFEMDFITEKILTEVNNVLT